MNLGKLNGFHKGDQRVDIVRQGIFVFKKLNRARLYTVAHGLYEVYINELKLGDEYLTPGYHSYDLLQRIKPMT